MSCDPIPAVLERVEAQREALQHWTLHDFKILVETMGIEEVIKAMDEETCSKLYNYFKDRA